MQPHDSTDMTSDDLSARDLARHAGVSRRTVHYYASEGLLPAPSGVTRAATYSPAHLARLRLILALRDEGLSLASIRQRLAPLSDAQALEVVAALDAHLVQPDAAPLSTLGLIDAALQAHVIGSVPVPDARDIAPTPAASTSGVPRDSARDYIARVLSSTQSVPRPPAVPLPQPAAPAVGPPPSVAPTPPPEAWRHYRVADGVELRVREDRYLAAKGRIAAVVDALGAELRRHGLLGNEPPRAP
jgi:DNA-binding transcriptional MerR regulator